VDGEKFALDYISGESDETVWPGESEYLYNLTVPGISLTWLTASPKLTGGLLIKTNYISGWFMYNQKTLLWHHITSCTTHK